MTGPSPTGADPGAGSHTATGMPEGAAPSPPPGLAAFSVFDDLTDLVVVLDADFGIVYANVFARELLGYRDSEVAGHSITEFLSADDIGRALEVTTLMADDRMGVRITPALYGLQRADGTWLPVELNAVHSPEGTPPGHLLVIGRYSGDHALQNQILEMITGGRSDAELISVLPGFGSWRHPHEQYGVLYRDVDGTDQVAATDILANLLRAHPGPDTPWSHARRQGEPVLTEPADLPAPLRADATAAGLGTCWAFPVTDPLHDVPAVLIGWSRVEGPPASVHRYALEIMGRMLTLILQWRRQREALERAARRDPLTQVVNRAGFFEVLGQSLDRASELAMVGLLYVDLDGFKDVNDGYGHSVGDDVLRIVADRLSAAVRREDLIGRLGGDEFAVLCPAVTDLAALTVIARRIIDDVSAPISVRGVDLRVGASIGIATSIGTALPDQLVDAADRSLYLAKAAGRGRWHLAEDGDGPATDPGVDR